MKNIPQLMPSDYCLSCKGCCFFKQKKSLWRPQLSLKEQKKIKEAKDYIDEEGRITTSARGKRHVCYLLEEDNHKCRIYGKRPFECALYPFLFVKKKEKCFLAVHLACPYVQEKRGAAEFDQYMKEVKTFLQENLPRRA